MFFMDPFFWDLFVNGLLIGCMYALVAVGFVLIYKATSVINFAQGDLVMFGGYIAAAGLSLYHLPLWTAAPIMLALMVVLGFALERGILDAGFTGSDAGFGQRWYEVTKYLNCCLISWPAIDMVMNKKAWDRLPPDLQAILIEEAAKAELELLRIGSIQNEVGILRNTKQGMEYLEFSPELRALSDKAVIERVIPNWAKRVGGPASPWAKIFNEKVGPVVGFRVEADGSAVKVPIVK